MFCFYFSFLHLQCPQIFLLLRRDSVALDGLLDGLVVRPESKVELLDVGNRLVPLLGKGGGEEPGYPSLYCLANWLTKLNLYVFMAFWIKAALVAHYAWQLTLASATIGYEICQHSACFLPTFVGKHEFCPTYVCAKYWEKHWTSGWCMSLDTYDSKSCTHSVPFPRRGIAGGVCLLRLYLKFVMPDDLLSCWF